MQQSGHTLDAAGALDASLTTDYKRKNPVSPSPLSLDTVENRFEDTLKRERSDATEGEKMEEALSDPEEEMDTGWTYSPGTTRKLLLDLSEEWANTATPPLGSPRNNRKLQPGVNQQIWAWHF